MAVFVTFFVASMSTWFLVEKHKMDSKERWHFSNKTLANYLLPALQLLNFFMLTVSIIILFILLEKQQKYEDIEQLNAFKREKFVLIIILVIFDIEYFLRGVYNIRFDYEQEDDL